MPKFRDNLTGKTNKQRADLKGREIARVSKKGRKQRGEFRIDVLEVNEIDGGVEVFARVFGENGKQIGFGEDGSVDIERFRFFNPPILVPDPAGDIVYEWQTEVAKDEFITNVERFREDPEEALLMALEDTVRTMKNKHGDRNIVPEKRGNTVSTFYTAAGDGWAYARKDSWNAVTTSSTASNKSGSTSGFFGHTDQLGQVYATNWPDGSQGNMFAYRLFFPFDTSALGDGDTINSATFSAYLTAKGLASGAQSGLYYLRLVESTQASGTAIVAADYAAIGSTALATDLALSGASTSAFADWVLNSTGRGLISKTGYTKLALRSGWDVTDTQSTGADYAHSYAEFRQSEYTGTTNDPKLVIDHTSSVSVSPAATTQVCAFSIPAYTVSAVANPTVAATVLAAAFVLVAPAVSAGASVTANTLSAAFSIPTYEVEAGDVVVNASTLSAAFSVPAYTVVPEVYVTVPASTLSAAFSIPSYTAHIDAGGAPSTLEATFSIPAYTVSVTANPTYEATTLSAAFSLPSTAVGLGVELTATTLVAAFSIPTVTVTVEANPTVLASVLVATFSTPEPSFVGGVWRKQPIVTDEWDRVAIGE